ncbi:MAG TPA: AI-2E family transporter [Polyangiaceae bacterium]
MFGVAASIALVVLTSRVLLVLFAGVLFALVLRAAASAAERRLHMPYKVAVAACVVVFVVSAGLGFYFALPAVGAQVREVGKTLPDIVQRVSQTLHLPALGIGLNKPQDLAANIEKLASHAVIAVGTSVEVFGGFVVLFFVGVYGAADPESYSKILLWCVPSSKKRVVRRIVNVSAGNLQRWLLGRLVAMLFVGVTSGIAFGVLHVPLAFPLAVLAGLLTFVEYVGAFASAGPPILLALSQSPTRALWVAIVFAVLHVIEGYVLTPLLAKTAVRFPPATTLASQALLSALLGPLGLTFATPLLVVLVTAAQEWRKTA